MRVLVATDHLRCPDEALRHARALAGAGGEVVLAAVLVVPVTQPLDAALDRAVRTACDVLEAGERRIPGEMDTRLVRARSFAKGVLETLAAEPFDLLVLERPDDGPGGAGQHQVDVLLDRAPVTVVVVRPALSP